MKWNTGFAHRVSAMGNSDVLKMLLLSERPDIISLAGGLPDPAIYLLDEISEVTRQVLEKDGRAAFGYGAIAGLTPFRDWLAQRTTQMGRPTKRAEIMVTTGGVAAIDLVTKVFINPGDTIIVGEPTYTAALHIFRSYEAKLIGVPLDDQGMKPEALEQVLADLKRQGTRAKFLYMVPSFHNPASVTIPEDRRRRISNLAREYSVPIIEDTAYRPIRFEGIAPPMMAELDPENVITVNTMSKILNPGIRLGWVAAPEEIIETLVLAKQGQDQCSSTIGQYLALALGERGLVDKQTKVATGIYRRKRDVTLAALEKYMPERVSWTRPEGGFYTWMTLPKGVDTAVELDRAVAEEHVAYTPGSAFHHQRKAENCLRLSYSYVSEAQLEEGISRLARIIARAIGRNNDQS